ncbi:heterokaryon incompatibility protein-domain-containing protein [Paraphoma chrysanthemicola]|uniref:Heterokaryon incompatibility protein-domain-containing protein n=1 Tax=Paraphoma chrysanthemicola TaxID=798071 RepID=A0A8K0RF61_9PLEO|nr:heterokaryon incompatibility protein-domain-containing protein [Paraphoma chrysanthemicola]
MAAAAYEPPGPLFEHQSLDLEHQSFRLLRLLPTSHVDAIDCELTVEASPSVPQDRTKAESPDDGNDHAPHHWILINKGYFKIRHNLWEFLRMAVAKLHTQSELDFAEPLWIDAVCINQEALFKRAHQVKKMGDIYRCARAVFVWLGPSCSQQLNAVSQDLKLLGLEADRSPSQMTPYDRFLQSRYLRDEVIGSSTCQSVPTMQTIKALTLGEKHNAISDAVAQYQNSQCSDPRDKVYATLGMVPDGGSFPIDYSIDLEHLFYQIMTASYECTYNVEEPVGETELAQNLVLRGSASSHERRVDTTSLSSINNARQSLEIPFSALEELLAANPMIAEGVQTKFSKPDRFEMKPGPDVADHCFYIDCWSSPLLQSCTVVMRVSQIIGEENAPNTCRVLFVPRYYLNGPPLYMKNEISFVGSWFECSK